MNRRSPLPDMISASMGDHPWSLNSKTLLVSRASATGQTAVYSVDRESGIAKQLLAA